MRFALLCVLMLGCGEKLVRGPSGPPPEPPVDAAPVVVADPPPPTLRLGDEVRLDHGWLDLTIDPAQPQFSGVARYTGQATAAVPVVWLNATDLTITSAKLNGTTARVVPGNADFIGLALPAAIQPGTVEIEVAWTGTIIRGRALGLYAEAENGLDYAYTVFEPLDARRAFPCFDQPDSKIPWTLSFHVKKDHVALANAPVARETDEGNGMKRVELDESKPMPSYLVAFVVGPFEITDGGTAGKLNTPVRFIAPRGRAAELRYAKEITPKVVAGLEEYTGIDYPFVKLDVAVPPRYWGTMEHPGIVAMGQSLTLIKPTEETRSRKQEYVNILAHELAHYWFGDLVTMKWWDDTWLNEALGEWMDAIITDRVVPEWKFKDLTGRRAFNAMVADERVSVRPVRNVVDTRDAVQASFDNATTYYKGQSVLAMFEHSVGPARWQAFIHAYLTRFAWKNASADDFFGVMSDELGAETAAAMRTFVDQPGVPLVSHELRCNANQGSLVLKQQRAFPTGSSEAAARSWTFPVCVRYGAGKAAHEQCTSFPAASREITVSLTGCPTWLVMNAGGLGYHRSSYTAKELAALLGPKSPATFTERAFVLADISAAIARGELLVGDAMALAPLVVKDADDRLRNRIGWLTSDLRPELFADADWQRYQAWALKIVGPTARSLGWARKARDTDDRHALRLNLTLFVSGLGDKRLYTEADKLTRAWLADRTSIPDDTASTALLAAARRGDASLFDAILAAAKASKEPALTERLLTALGRFENPALATRALDLVLGPDFGVTDAITIPVVMLFNRETSTLAWTWLKTHRDEIIPMMRADQFAYTVIGNAGSAFCDAAHRAEVEATFAPIAPALEGAQYTLTSALEQIDQCIAVQAQLSPSALAFLQKH